MIRKQIYIPETMNEDLTKLAKVRGEPAAQIVREFIEEGVKKATEIDYTGKKALRSLMNIKARGGPKDLSTNLDYYLYGEPKREE
jgi:predicted DNA-binding protein